MTKKITILKSITFEKTPTFSSLEASISYSKEVDVRRKSEMCLDLSLIQGKTIRQFHWDDQHLLLEFETDLFLVVSIEETLLKLQIEKCPRIISKAEEIYEITFSQELQLQINAQEIADKYQGKKFLNVTIGDHYAWLYFEGMRDLIFCTIDVIKESNNLFLSWNESE